MPCQIQDYQLRALGIVLKDLAEDLAVSINAIHDITDSWQLDREDFFLPSPTSVKLQIEAYESLTIQPISLTDYKTELKQCTDIIPNPVTFPEGVTFSSPEPVVF